MAVSITVKIFIGKSHKKCTVWYRENVEEIDLWQHLKKEKAGTATRRGMLGQAAKVANSAAAILKMIRHGPRRQVKSAAALALVISNTTLNERAQLGARAAVSRDVRADPHALSGCHLEH